VKKIGRVVGGLLIDDGGAGKSTEFDRTNRPKNIETTQ
jgi:hypothetical protein